MFKVDYVHLLSLQRLPPHLFAPVIGINKYEYLKPKVHGALKFSARHYEFVCFDVLSPSHVLIANYFHSLIHWQSQVELASYILYVVNKMTFMIVTFLVKSRPNQDNVQHATRPPFLID